MNTTRESHVVRAGRVFQKHSHYFGFLDYLVRLFFLRKEPASSPVVCIVAPPRSGSTLSYQLLTSGIENIHLSNLWHLLYATPALGGLLSKYWCKGYRCTFKSHHGLVSGMCGEAEGREFWIHWGGQTIWERPDNLGPKRLLKLAGVLSRLGDGEAFITGYPAHAFYMHMLRRTFADIIFVHIKRDLVSNAYSLFKASEKGWFSSTPKKCQLLRFDTPHERVVAQLFAIHERILEQSKPHDTLQCSYHEVCHMPDETIDRIIDFAQSRGIELTRKGPIPSTFDAHLVHAHQNTDTLVLDRCINTYLQQSSYPSFFASLR